MIPISLTTDEDESRLDWFRDLVRTMVWADDPKEQVAANLFFFLLALLASKITLGATLIIAFITAVLAGVGFARILYGWVTELFDGGETIAAGVLIILTIAVLAGVFAGLMWAIVVLLLGTAALFIYVGQ